MKTPISYYGGKQAIINHILAIIPPHEIYTETFFGGGTVFWAKDPVRNETINDRLDIVINFYKVLKLNYRPLKKMIDVSLISRSMQQTATRMLKKQIPADSITLAWAFWYACNFSFVSKIGGGLKFCNEPNAIVTTTLLNKKREFTDMLCARLEQTQIECGEAMYILKLRNVPTALHYLDTPYFNADMGHYSGYTEADFKSLLHWCATECKGKFILSNYSSDTLTAATLANGWNTKTITHQLKAQRKSGTEKKEVLTWNFNIQQQPDLFNQK